MTRVLAIDLGGTNLRGAVCHGDPSALADTGRFDAPDNLETLAERVKSLREEAGAIEAVGVSIPGLVAGSVCRWVPNLPYLDGVDLQTLFPDVRVTAGNDAHFALLAEATAGAAKSMSDVILLAIGTGIGSAVLADGRIVVGANGAACSFGWACADLEDAGDERGGWLERTASGRAFDAAARSIGMANGTALIAASSNGNRQATEALDLRARSLGVALAGVVGLLAPEAILVSGGVADALDVIAVSVRAALDRQLPPHLRGVQLRAGAFGPRAGLAGAAIAGAVGENWRLVR